MTWLWWLGIAWGVCFLVNRRRQRRRAFAFDVAASPGGPGVLRFGRSSGGRL